MKKKTIPAQVKPVVMCEYFNCKNPASIRIPRANTNLCEFHYILNIERFGCYLKGEKIVLST
jgi:hypothetical protein